MSEQDREAPQPDPVDPAVESPEESAAPEPRPDPAEEWPVRRALIRATLTPPEGAPPVQREPPVFTMHQQQPPPRGGNGGNRGNGNVRAANGNVRADKGNSARSARRNERGGQFRNGSPSRSASSRRGRGRSR